MRDIVIVPTYDRPEYLWLCLQKLSYASGIENKEIWVCEDNHDIGSLHKSPHIVAEMREVSDDGDSRFPDRFRWIRREPHSSYGNSYNVLEAFREAYTSKAEHIYLVEDDVLVMPDFFQWHEAVHQQWAPFVSCAGRINNSLNFERNGREAIDESCNDPLACVASRKAYGSWAACFHRNSLGCILRSTDAGRFYEKIKPGFEQDIYIQYLMRQTSITKFSYDPRSVDLWEAFSVWPYVPRAYHMGMQSYHRNAGLSFNGSLSEKVQALRDTVSNPAKICSMALLQNDIDPYPEKWQDPWKGPLYLKADYR